MIIYLHIGLPKTATTVIQDILRKRKIEKDNYIFLTKLDYVDKYLKRNSKKNPQMNIIVSNERYSKTTKNLQMVISYIKKWNSLHQIKILVNLREVSNYVQSTYLQYIKDGTFNGEFDDFVTVDSKGNLNTYNNLILNYMEILNPLKAINNVQLYLNWYEYVFVDEVRYFHKFFHFIFGDKITKDEISKFITKKNIGINPSTTNSWIGLEKKVRGAKRRGNDKHYHIVYKKNLFSEKDTKLIMNKNKKMYRKLGAPIKLFNKLNK